VEFLKKFRYHKYQYNLASQERMVISTSNLVKIIIVEDAHGTF